jgi:hypothetical protein
MPPPSFSIETQLTTLGQLSPASRSFTRDDNPTKKNIEPTGDSTPKQLQDCSKAPTPPSDHDREPQLDITFIQIEKTCMSTFFQYFLP